MRYYKFYVIELLLLNIYYRYLKLMKRWYFPATHPFILIKRSAWSGTTIQIGIVGAVHNFRAGNCHCVVAGGSWCWHFIQRYIQILTFNHYIYFFCRTFNTRALVHMNTKLSTHFNIDFFLNLFDSHVQNILLLFHRAPYEFYSNVCDVLLRIRAAPIRFTRLPLCTHWKYKIKISEYI